MLRYVSPAGVVQLDPLATTIYPTLILGLQIFVSLYSLDEHFQPRPQMAAGHTIEDDGKRWVIRLRDGLRFHDGEPVLARDCTASINRHLHAEADSQERHFALCGETNCLDLAWRAAFAEAAGNRNAMHPFQPHNRVGFFEDLAVDPFELNIHPVGDVDSSAAAGLWSSSGVAGPINGPATPTVV